MILSIGWIAFDLFMMQWTLSQGKTIFVFIFGFLALFQAFVLGMEVMDKLQNG